MASGWVAWTVRRTEWVGPASQSGESAAEVCWLAPGRLLSEGETFEYLYKFDKVVMSDARGAAGETSACDSNDPRRHKEHHSVDKQPTNGCGPHSQTTKGPHRLCMLLEAHFDGRGPGWTGGMRD